MQLPRFSRLPLAPENCKDYEIQQSYMERVIDMISSDCRKENPLKISELKASEENGDLSLNTPDENEPLLSEEEIKQILRSLLFGEEEEEVTSDKRKRKSTDSAEGHKHKIGPAIHTTSSSTTGSSNFLREYDFFEEELYEEIDSSEDEDEDEEDEEIEGVSDFIMTKAQVKLWDEGYRW
jgi:hypothetical protein